MGGSAARLDKLLVDRGLVPSRQRAQALIMAAQVLVDGEKVTKAGHLVPLDCEISIAGEDMPYVSRGGLKLERALDHFAIDPAGRVAMDVGASTGGFTDCLLQRGAERVYAIDVGYGQLAWKLRSDPRVVVIERQNIRHLPREAVPDTPTLAVIDTSFISLKIVIPAVLSFLSPEAELVALIKPQFEAGKGQVGKGGVVRDSAIHDRVCAEIDTFLREQGLTVKGLTESPILGPKGNHEFLIAASIDS